MASKLQGCSGEAKGICGKKEEGCRVRVLRIWVRVRGRRRRVSTPSIKASSFIC
jgi:hypothetical protein